MFTHNTQGQTVPDPRPTVIGNTESTIYYYFNDEGQMDEESGMHYFNNNRGYDAEGQEILKVRVTHSRPIFDNVIQRGAEESSLEPTIFIVPGGGFFIVDSTDFTEGNICTSDSTVR
jgi:hypothetical protein